MKKRLRVFLVLLLFSIVSACAQSTPVPTATSVPTDTPSPTETPLPTLTSTPTEVPREPTGPQAGTTLIHVDGSTLVYIPAGEFEMGGGGSNNPIHPVSLRGYWIQKTEVTRRMYAMCIAAGGCTDLYDPSKSGYVADSAYSDMPVVDTKFGQAQSYCAWMGGRLPTEAEWEYAARGTSGNTYPWGGDEPTCDLLNFNDCVGNVTRATKYQTDISPFGVLGMAGNVREWVNDYFDGNYYKNSPSQNPTGPQKGNYYVVRGGGYQSPAENTKAYHRDFIKVTGNEMDLGFRCLVDNPVTYAPYCEASPYLQGDQSIQPIDRCEPGVKQELNQRGLPPACNITSITVEGGELVSVTAEHTTKEITCEPKDNQSFVCTGTGVPWAIPSIPVTVCATCADSSSSNTLSLTCPLNYKTVDGADYCQYTGGAVPDYCPPNSVPLNENQCVYKEVQAGSCPLGSYFDEGMNACVTVGQTPLECMDGFRYDFDQSCCMVSQPNLEYPVCKRDEYYSSEFGCSPIPSSDIQSCRTLFVKHHFCG